MNARRFTIFAFLLAIVALIVGLSACDQIGQLLLPATSQMEALSGEISIGAVLALTGRHAAPYGLPMQRGFELALEEINNSGRLDDAKITFIIEDDRSTIEGGVEAFNKLIHQDGVSAILGPTTSSTTKEAFPIAQENQVVVIGPTSAAPGLSAIGDFVFRVSLTADKLVPIGVQMTHEQLGYQRVAKIVDSVDFFSQSNDVVLSEALNANGIEILITETFETGETDFSAQLTRIKESNPDAIFISALSPETTEILIQGHQLGIPTNVPFLATVLASDQIQLAGDAAEGAITFTNWINTASTPGNQAFVQNYQATYSIEPNIWAVLSYASVYILAEAIEAAQSTDSSAIQDALANIMGFDTILGLFSFDAVGDAVYDPQILIVKNGQLQVFK